MGRAPEFRSAVFVLAAYAIAPVASAVALWLVVSLIEVMVGRYSIGDVLKALPLVVMVITFLGLIAELCIVTPFLLALRRYRWNWMNIWWFAGIGLAIGETGNFLFDIVGPRHWFGWGAVLQGVSVSGFTGMIAATVFYLIAFRREPLVESTQVFE